MKELTPSMADLNRRLTPMIPHGEIQEWREQGLEFESNLEDRILKHLRYKYIQREEGEQRWMYEYGSYTNKLFLGEREVESVNGVELVGVEVAIFRQIMNIREKKDLQGDDSPVVAIDFGGRCGISMMRIATALSELVDSNRLLVLITSIAFYPDADGIRSIIKSGNYVNPSDIEQAPQRVHFGQADAEELLSALIDINDNQFPAEGNVDIVHEADALKHVHIGDIDLPRIGKLLSRYGTFFTKTKYLEPDRYLFFPGDEDEEKALFLQKRLAYLQGEANLQRMGIPKMDLGDRKSEYTIYAMPEAPRI